MRWLLALGACACALSLACTGSVAPAPKSAAVAALPADLAAEVHESELLGRAIFDRDLAASRASEALLEATGGEPDPRMRGFVLRSEGRRWRVEFFGSESPPSVLWQAVVEPFGAGVSLERLEPPRALDPEGERMARARLTATSQPFDPCASRYDPVVLPASLIGRKGFLVYLIAANVNRGEWIVGGHQRFLISEDGASVLDHKALSRGCLAMPASRSRHAARHGAWVTHIVSDAPAETHVYLSLLYQSPIFVGTRRGVWKVSGEKISFVAVPSETRR